MFSNYKLDYQLDYIEKLQRTNVTIIITYIISK